MSEGSLEAPTRHPIPWREPEYTDAAALEAETRRVFDICHGCRRCFNLCDSFPRLFDLIDESETGELDSVASNGFQPVVDACTLCDMCFMTKCPYVPPHEFDLDFPHLMLRHRAKAFRDGKVPAIHRQLTKTDRNGKLAGGMAGLANWASRRENRTTRGLLEKVADVHRDADLPKYHGRTFEKRAKAPAAVNADAPAHGRKAVLYATCFVNYNNPDIGMDARAVLALNGVETEVVYPECCGMPQLEQGDIAEVARRAEAVSAELVAWIGKGYDIVALVPSCALMFKFEWPLIVPGSENVKRLSEAARDISEYIVDIAGEEGLAPGAEKLDGGVSFHFACHARAQNMGAKGAALLRLIPGTDVKVIERCSGHGGSWGVMKDNFETALKVGRPVARQAGESGAEYVLSECPLAREHILQGIEKLDGAGAMQKIKPVQHPVQLLAEAYGLRRTEGGV